MASVIVSNLLAVSSPLIKRGVGFFFRQDVSLLTIQNYISMYGKVSMGLGFAVGCANFFHAMWTVASMTKNEFGRGQIRIIKYEDFPGGTRNKSYPLSFSSIMCFSCLKWMYMDAFWPLLLINFAFGMHRIPSMIMTLEISL
jgi:hypothetical protein